MFKKIGCIIFILCFLALGLSGCGSKRIKHGKGDGAPKHIPNLDRIPNAIPKVEPLGRGNRFKKNSTNVYTEKNRRYKVMSTSKGYKKQGAASWYGTLFHGRRTSSGEPYNMFAMTAAHPTLPIPTYVKVTNLKNKKAVIVKVNDRGPFRCNRLIDLSYVAAAKLGILQAGTGHVEVQSVDPRDHGHYHAKRLLADKALILAKPEFSAKKTTATRPAPPITIPPVHNTLASPAPLATIKPVAPLTPPKPISIAQTKTTEPPVTPTPKKMYLQMGDFNQKANASALVQKIGRIANVPTNITETKLGTSSRFLVTIGPLKNHMEAIKLTQQLAQQKIPCPTIITGN